MTIDRDLWQRARPLFDEIIDLDPDTRRARLETIGRSEPALRDALDRLLQGDIRADDALRRFDFAAGSRNASSPPIDLDPLGIVGRTVSHFNVTDFVAAGGMGVVYKGADVTLGRVVAIKFPLPHQRMDDEAKERFLHEARSVAALDHPNLCTVYEFGESAHGLYLAMPFYQGETLKDRISRVRILPAADAISIARQVAAGLSSAHAAGIVHRDLKPGNVMLLPDGAVKILDFGIAKVRDVQLTRTGVALGTIAYMSPGQAAGERTDAQADLWAIGVMLYEMLTGVLPFRGSNEVAVLHAIMHADPEPPSRVNKEVPSALDTVVSGLLQKDSARRYPSATALLTDLDAATAGAPVTHKLPVSSRRAGRTLRRAALSASVVLAVATAAWLGRPLLHGAATADASPRTLVVLPFAVREGNEASTYVASGLANELTDLLSRRGGVHVVAQSAAAELQRQKVAAHDIAQRLGATHIVDGTLRIAADTFYLAVHLTRMRDSLLLWDGDFRAPVAQVVTLDRQIADSVLRALQSAVRVASVPLATTDPVAYDLYLKARYAWSRRTSDRLDEAIAYYRGALDRDPNFAPAYSGMADALVNLSNFGWSMSHREALQRAEVAANKALALDSSLAEGYASRAMVLMSRQHYPEAEASIRRAIQLNPNFLWAHHYYSLLLQMTGRFAESGAEAERALAIDAFAGPPMAHLGVTLLTEGKVQEAREQLQKALALQPTFPVALQYLAAIEADTGDYPAAEKHLLKALERSAGFSGVRGALAYTYMKSGRAAEARTVMAGARAAVTDERSRVDYGLALAIVGSTDSAFAMLRTAEWDIPTLIELRSDPLLRSFRSDPRYPQLLSPLGLKP